MQACSDKSIGDFAAGLVILVPKNLTQLIGLLGLRVNMLSLGGADHIPPCGFRAVEGSAWKKQW